MTAWIVGHTDRFCSAVSHRGVYNLLSFTGTMIEPLLRGPCAGTGTEPCSAFERLPVATSDAGEHPCTRYPSSGKLAVRLLMLQQPRQLGNVGGDPPRLVAGEQIGRADMGYRGLISSASIMRRRSAKACTFPSAGAMTFSARVASSGSSPSYR